VFSFLQFRVEARPRQASVFPFVEAVQPGPFKLQQNREMMRAQTRNE